MPFPIPSISYKPIVHYNHLEETTMYRFNYFYYYNIFEFNISLSMQPFGQVPAFEDGDLKLFGKCRCSW